MLSVHTCTKHLLLALLWIFILACQSEKKQALYAGAPAVSDTTVFAVIEQRPQFPGGQRALEAFIAQQLKYPAEDLENKPAGTTYVQGIVERDGTLSRLSILRTPSRAMASEALRICTLMPPWQPGKSMGQTYRSRITIPFHFKAPKS